MIIYSGYYLYHSRTSFSISFSDFLSYFLAGLATFVLGSFLSATESSSACDGVDSFFMYEDKDMISDDVEFSVVVA